MSDAVLNQRYRGHDTIPFSVEELWQVAAIHAMDLYHRDLMVWAARTIEALTARLPSEPPPVTPISPHDALRQLMNAVDALRDPAAKPDQARAAVIDAAIAFVAMSRGQFTTPQPRENR